MSAKASGADATPNGAAKNREHSQGNQERKYTSEQQSAVIRVRKCAPTAFYDILGLQEVKTTVTDAEIKKAYRKLSLLTHPDKNGHEHADEAFKMVSRAFGVLGDPDKKAKFDKFGGDPDSRFGGGASQSPFAGFGGRTPNARGGGGRGGSVWEEEISPEEMFNRFFGGGMGGGFGPFGGFDQGPAFAFNLGGGPGIRVHQFGGARPRRRPQAANGEGEPAPSLISTITSLLPLLLFFLVPLLTSLFSGAGSGTGGPSLRFDSPKHPHTLHRKTPRMKIDYYVNPGDVEHFTPYKFNQLDKSAEVSYIQQLRIGCEHEKDYQHNLRMQAQGWFTWDAEKLRQADNLEMQNCKRMDDLGLARTF